MTEESEIDHMVVALLQSGVNSVWFRELCAREYTCEWEIPEEFAGKKVGK